MTLKPALSAYLDFMRFTAAFAVLLGHMDQDGLSMAWMPLSRFSHEAVVVFFALSGFIIFYSTASRASTWCQYAVARLSRIYSVALPSVLLCVGLALCLSIQPGFDPSHLSNYSRPTVGGAVSSLLFLNESWLNGSLVPLNDPYWSLCYEVWYYVMFGVCFFLRGALRWVLVSAAAVLAGLAVLTLFPIWIMGAWLAATDRHDAHWRTSIGVLAFVLPLCVLVLINISGLDRSIQSMLYERVPGYWRLDGSQRFVTDYLIGAALCVHIAAFSSLPAVVQGWFERHQATFAMLAGFSFTLYLFHRPMTQLLGANYPLAADEVGQSTMMALGILGTCWCLSWLTERQLPVWRRCFATLF